MTIAPNPNTMQLTLNILENWCLDNMIAVNTTKTKNIKFRSRGTKVKDYFRITYAGEEIEYVDNFKHLGVQINYFLSDKVHTDYLYHKGLNSIGALASKVDINKINNDSTNRLFQSITLGTPYTLANHAKHNNISRQIYQK